VNDAEIAKTEVSEEGATPGVDDEARGTPGVDTTGTPGVDATDGGTTGVDAKQSLEADNTEASQAALERDMEDKYGPRSERYNMRKRRERDYSHLFVTRMQRPTQRMERIHSQHHR
jgi:hypothetical protein